VTVPEACSLLADTLRDLSAERAVHAETAAERERYREIAKVAFDELAITTRRLDRATEANNRLRNELRQHTTREAAA